MSKKYVLFSLVLSLFLSLSAGAASASGEPQLQKAPLSPAFLAYQESAAQRAVRFSGGSPRDEGPRGYVPSPVDFSHLRYADYSAYFGANTRRRSALPTSYDLRTENAVTPVRDQRPYGTCWAFSALGSMESVYLRKGGGALDLSAMHLAYYTYQDPAGFTRRGVSNLLEGGNDIKAVAMLARWVGPVLERDLPYPVTPSGASSQYANRLHLQDAYFADMQVPGDRSGANDIRKELIASYGAISIAYHGSSVSAPYNEATSAWYGGTAVSADHAVLAVGWDDHYSRENFNANSRPAGDGAWLIKNSWGAAWGQDGYFWLSYEDKTIEDGVVYLPEEATNYDNLYDYDTLGMCVAVGYRAPTAWMANVFQARGHEILEAVSFYTPDANAAYEISVYTSLKNAGNPTSGTRASQPQTGSQVFAGYHTVRLNTPVPLPSGTSFSVVVKMTTPSYNYPIVIECRVEGYSEGATAGRGESFISPDGNRWEDGGADASDPANVCLKAFTINSSVPIPDPDPVPTPDPGGSGGSGGGGGCSAASGALSLAALLPFLHRKKREDDIC